MGKRYLIHDSIYLGALVGAILPALGSAIYRMLEFTDYSWEQYYTYIFNTEIFARLISLCVITNLVSMYGFHYIKYDKAIRGVIFITLLYAVVSVILLFA